MIRYLISTFLVFTIALNVSAESFDVPNSSDHESVNSEKSNLNNSDIVSIKAVESCEDCPDGDCHDEAGHCAHHCSGIHNVLVSTVPNYTIAAKINFLKESNWHFSSHYKNPYLDSIIVPPCFS